MSARLRALPAVAALAVGVLASSVHAQAPAPAAAEPTPPYTLTGNFGIYSQYIFRGLTQTDGKPAFQGGFDFNHESGFYLGTWGSNISWISDSGACNHGCSLEWDAYGGWKKVWNDEWGLDLGILQYWYPGSYNPGFSSANTTELYIAGSWKWASLKFSDSISGKTFGVPNSRGTWYLEANVAYPIDQWTLIGHAGRQEYHGNNNGIDNGNLDYTDWKLGVTYTFPGNWTVGGYWTDTNASSSFYTIGGKNIGKSTGTAFIQKTF